MCSRRGNNPSITEHTLGNGETEDGASVLLVPDLRMSVRGRAGAPRTPHLPRLRLRAARRVRSAQQGWVLVTVLGCREYGPSTLSDVRDTVGSCDSETHAVEGRWLS